MQRSDFEVLLDSYPRVRPPLSQAQQARYVCDYQTSRKGSSAITGLILKMEGWMHREVAARHRGGRILELGAGTLNHLSYERDFDTYEFVEPFVELWCESTELARTSAQYQDIDEVPLDRRYDRIISIAVLEHLTSLPQVVSRSAFLLAENGSFQAGIPSEGGFLWGTAWRCFSGPAYRLRTGMSYRALMRHEHVNTAREILLVIRYLFTSAVVRRFPLPSEHLSFYTCIEARGPRLDRCRKVLDRGMEL